MKKLICLLRSLEILWTGRNAGSFGRKNHSQGRAAGVAWLGHPSWLCCSHISSGHHLGRWILLLALREASWNEFQTVPISFCLLLAIQSDRRDHQIGQAWVTCPTCPWQGELASDPLRFSKGNEALPFIRWKGVSDAGQLKEWHMFIKLWR